MELFKIIMYTLIGIIFILFIYAKIHNDIKTCVLKINSVESEIDITLRKKFDLILKIISMLREEENEELFKDYEEIKDEELSSFEFERKLLDTEVDILNYSTKYSKNAVFNGITREIENINTKLEAEEKYYNENTTKYNDLISKFPTKIVGSLMRLKEKKYFDGKDMSDKNIKDFKI